MGAPPATRPGDLVLITGVTGRIGANLARSLLAGGYRVRGIALPGDPRRAKLAALPVQLVEGDLRDAALVGAACDGVDAIVHLAALMTPEMIDSPSAAGIARDFWGANVDATLSVLEGARGADAGLRKFVYASSDAVYAAVRPRYLPIDEAHPQEPVNLYGLTKVVGERLCLDYLDEWGIPVAILRFGAVATPDERLAPPTIGGTIARLRAARTSHDNYLWAVVGECERPWEALTPWAHEPDTIVALTDRDGRPWVSHPTDVRDVVAGIVLALEREAAVGEAFNIVGPAPAASTVTVPRLAAALGRPYVTAPVPFRLAYELSTAKARALLGYRPEIDPLRAIDDGLAMRRGEEIGVIAGRPSG